MVGCTIPLMLSTAWSYRTTILQKTCEHPSVYLHWNACCLYWTGVPVSKVAPVSIRSTTRASGFLLFLSVQQTTNYTSNETCNTHWTLRIKTNHFAKWLLPQYKSNRKGQPHYNSLSRYFLVVAITGFNAMNYKNLQLVITVLLLLLIIYCCVYCACSCSRNPFFERRCRKKMLAKWPWVRFYSFLRVIPAALSDTAGAFFTWRTTNAAQLSVSHQTQRGSYHHLSIPR